MKPEIHSFLRSVITINESNLCIMLSKDPDNEKVRGGFNM